MDRRRRGLLGLVSLTALAGLGLRASAQSEPMVIKVEAKKFEYIPGEIRLAVGVPVVFELSGNDTEMGFNIPDFKVRGDIFPGKVTRVPFTPERAGTFTFYCDVFCGSGHEDMSGTLIVA